MNIVIDIPEEFEEHFKVDRFEDSLARIASDIESFGFQLSGRYEQETITMLREAIKNGTILPKVHGDLIDRDALDKNCESSEYHEIITSWLDLAPTIIKANNYKADKESEDEEMTIPKALSGACFHGEVWLKCPHCMSGNQMMGKQALYKQDGYKIYKCDECGKLFKDR